MYPGRIYTQTLHELVIDVPEKGKLVAILKSGGVCEITDLIVEEQFRRQGIGSYLVKYLLQIRSEQVHVFTKRSNGVARQFYQNLGMFEVIVPGYYPEEDACLFVNRIRP